MDCVLVMGKFRGGRLSGTQICCSAGARETEACGPLALRASGWDMQDGFMGSWAAKQRAGCVFATFSTGFFVTLFVGACLGCWAGS